MVYGAVVAIARLSSYLQVQGYEGVDGHLEASGMAWTAPTDNTDVDNSPSEATVPITPTGDYRLGRYVWLLDSVTPLDDPVPTKGRQKLWELEDEAAAKLSPALGE